jgi:hypothetical protein
MLIDKRLMRPRAVHFNGQPSHIKKMTILNMRTLSFMKMSISCLYWSSELGSLLSIVHVYLLSILKVTFSKSHKLWFIKKGGHYRATINE